MGIDQDYIVETLRRIPEGTHRCRIRHAEKTKSRSGNDMIVVELQLYGYQTTLRHYITFIPDRPQFASQMIAQMFDAFPSIAGNMDTSMWEGAIGACDVEYEEYMGTERPKVARMVPAEYQVGLPTFGSGIYVYDDQVLVPGPERIKDPMEELVRIFKEGMTL